MDDLYYPEKRDHYYKQAHHIKHLMRKLQTSDDVSEIFMLKAELTWAVAKLARIKYEDSIQYKSHMTTMLNDICKWGETDGKKT